ncbi:DegT/DnrJ/EryC1/StrS family aminotransferase [Actinomycetospora lutea]|uniref:DegT/DnrJ/EryC1/StrS family aminotransferase n=1 Tax=Actinomycetospora lutea TaxID=663604 RepID=UPI0023653F0B|nr:DegT/DnrJ/EryC1/StrS family aminotransferase [Actinomycetospora lutea]MDD7942004.1 DegT/DnrJ/EryC1/StrS family aminotransferase [Actinomycetospora lutea]
MGPMVTGTPDAATRVPFVDLGAMTHDVRAEVDAGWCDLLERSDFVGGESVERFERAWASYCGTDEAVAVANGTDALLLTLRGLGIGPGDEVVVPANTFVATVEAVVLAGAIPRFADVDPATALLTPATLADALTPRTAAVLVVHLYGQPADMDALGEVAARAGVMVVEDAAQAHGATWRGRRAGSMGRAGCFSFYPGKNLGAFGDAGAVVTSDPALADVLRSLRNHGRIPGAHARHGLLVGTNSRMDTLQASVLAAKLARLDGWNAARRRIVERYRSALPPALARMIAVAPGAESVHHLAVLVTTDRDALRAGLAERGVESGLHYPVPCHRQAPYRRHSDRALPVCEALADQVVSLPLFPHMTGDQVEAVCRALHECGEERG